MMFVALLIAAVVQVTDAPFTMPPIPEAEIPAKDFPITDYGAKADGSNCRAAFAVTVKSCVDGDTILRTTERNCHEQGNV